MDDRQFRNAMGNFATGVNVITTEVDGDVHGMTANAFMSVSLDPKLVVISIGENASMLEKIRKSNRYAVNILSQSQKELSMIFAGQKEADRNVSFDRLGDLPVIKDAPTQISCEVVNEHVEGDHALFIGKVIDINLQGDADPLLFYKGKYSSIENSSVVM
ncbi:flavin reductase family protein [Oceanobacillus senegalensis]|uniref:flavin reductase family protein n=1 Tax=Oceanobacillus senegalensis TaxID=1936063 RepID=UPI000A308D5A|nr:flavin reductase family protein [Oceanobacillus senegalensis]